MSSSSTNSSSSANTSTTATSSSSGGSNATATGSNTGEGAEETAKDSADIAAFYRSGLSCPDGSLSFEMVSNPLYAGVDCSANGCH
ncbi:hypothetical protein FKM82_029108 [Ascaphus truei]